MKNQPEEAYKETRQSEYHSAQDLPESVSIQRAAHLAAALSQGLPSEASWPEITEALSLIGNDQFAEIITQNILKAKLAENTARENEWTSVQAEWLSRNLAETQKNLFDNNIAVYPAEDDETIPGFLSAEGGGFLSRIPSNEFSLQPDETL